MRDLADRSERSNGRNSPERRFSPMDANQFGGDKIPLLS
jgi:hypothetical protein